MEPTIYKPSIYKGAGIYNTGANGGGGEIPEGAICGKIYNYKVMPDGKKWLTENLDLKICPVGKSGVPNISSGWYYDNNEVLWGWNGRKCGLLYNGHFVSFIIEYGSDFLNGWRMPSLSDWDNLFSSVNYDTSKLKGSGEPWINWGGNNESGFNALPTGARDTSPVFYDSGSMTRFWTNDVGASTGHFIKINQDSSYDLNVTDDIKFAFSIRLIKD